MQRIKSSAHWHISSCNLFEVWGIEDIEKTTPRTHNQESLSRKNVIYQVTLAKKLILRGGRESAGTRCLLATDDKEKCTDQIKKKEDLLQCRALGKNRAKVRASILLCSYVTFMHFAYLYGRNGLLLYSPPLLTGWIAGFWLGWVGFGEWFPYQPH